MRKKIPACCHMKVSFRAIWETWATPPNISCFLNGKVRFWSVYVFFIKKKKIGVKNKGTILFTNHFDLGWKENSLIKIEWGPVQTSCFCRAELNSGIAFDKSTASESNFWIKFGKQLSSISAAVLHGSGKAAIQTSCFCRAKQNS